MITFRISDIREKNRNLKCWKSESGEPDTEIHSSHIWTRYYGWKRGYPNRWGTFKGWCWWLWIYSSLCWSQQLTGYRKNMVLSLYDWSFQGLYNSFFHADISGVSLEIKAEKILRLSHQLACFAKPCCLQKSSKFIQATKPACCSSWSLPEDSLSTWMPRSVHSTHLYPFSNLSIVIAFFPCLPCQNNFSPICPCKELIRGQLIYKHGW